MALRRLFERWGCRTSVTSGDMMLVPSPILERLVSLAFDRVAYSEAEYLAKHSDVAEAVRNKEFISGLQHFIWAGIKEDRELPAVQIDPDSYLKLNPDLVDAVGLKSPGEAVDHWMSVGWLEGRPHKK